MHKLVQIGLYCFGAIAIISGCQSRKDGVDEMASMWSHTQVISNIVFADYDSIQLHLDVYVPARKLGEPPWIDYTENRKPTLLFLHGGGWISGDKISRSLALMPYVQRGWCVVTADYRLLNQATLPEIVTDSRAALNWIYKNADKYKFDTQKIVVTGESAGGHLSLIAGLLGNNEIFDSFSKEPHTELNVAAIVNWYGVADLNKASKGWDDNYLQQVTHGYDNVDSILRVTSPTTYLSKDSPPILTIHGDQDTSAPYGQGVLLHERLKELGIKNAFLTIPGKKHGNFTASEMTMVYSELWKFLKECGIE